MTIKKIVLLVWIIAPMAMSCHTAKTAMGKDHATLRHAAVYGAGDYDFSLVHEGMERVYIVHAPKRYHRQTKTPVVLALHGGGGSAASSVKFFDLNNKADQNGFLVVYPEGYAKKFLGKTFAAWNAGSCCGEAAQKNSDDVGFIKAVLEKVQTDFNVDPQRIYVTGMSNGAQMAHRLACELSETIAAIAPVGSQGSFANCRPARPVPVLHIHGTEDPCSLYNGGICGGCAADIWKSLGASVNRAEWTCPSVPAYLDTWRKLNGCSEGTAITFQNKGALCKTHKNCKNGADVTLCTVQGMGHNWPGATSYGIPACDRRPEGKLCLSWKKTVGALSQDLIANDIMWSFFETHPKDLPSSRFTKDY